MPPMDLTEIPRVALSIDPVGRRRAIVGRYTLLIARLTVGARRLASTTSTFVQDVVPVNGFILVTSCFV